MDLSGHNIKFIYLNCKNKYQEKRDFRCHVKDHDHRRTIRICLTSFVTLLTKKKNIWLYNCIQSNKIKV